MPSSQNIRSESKMVPELRPVMPVDLFKAVIKGDRNLLIRRLGLETEEQTECQVTIVGASHSASEEINTESQTVQSELQNATLFGDTILHLLVTEGLDLKDFHRSMYLFKARNNMLETPLHCAAKVTTEGASHSAPEEINTENQTVQSELQSATRFGDTILHLLVTEGHNELALKVFQRDMSLFKARNNILETPLHCAAKAGNHMFLYNLIQSNCVVEKDALAQTNTNGETALHLAAKNGHTIIGYMIMNLDPEMAFKVNNKLFSPLYLVIVNEHTEMVQTMLEVDPTLACTPFSDGMFPVHEAARMRNVDLVKHFLIYFPDEAELRDPCGRNIFHIAAELKKDFLSIFFKAVLGEKAPFTSDFSIPPDNRISGEMIKRMNTAKDYEGNTPFHIASIVGDKSNMYAIWTHIKSAETVRNKHGLTPFQLSKRQQLETREDIHHESLIKEYLDTEGDKFTSRWFMDVMEPDRNKWDKVQIIGLGSVLITTVTFAAALTIPGGYNQDNGTPVLGRRYTFKAFVLANALAFILGFSSLFALLLGAFNGLHSTTFSFGLQTFEKAANCMVLAFGLGMYVTLAPVCYPIAVILLVISLFFGSPYGVLFIVKGEKFFRLKLSLLFPFLIVLGVMPFLFIFCLALL